MTAGKASEIPGKSKWCQSGLTPFPGAQNNSAGRLKSVTYNNSPGISENYQYTAAGEVTKKSLSVNGAGLNASYTYDNEGRMLTITYPGSAQYTYDSMRWGD